MTMLQKPQSNHVDQNLRLYLLEKTPIGRFYKRYFKRYRIIRFLAILAWKWFVPLGVRLYSRLSRKEFSRLPIVLLADAVGEMKIVVPSQKVVTPAVAVYPKEKTASCPPPHDAFFFPALYLGLLRDHVVRGGSNLLIGRCAVVHHDLFRISYDYTSEELHGRMVIKPKSREVFLASGTEEDIVEITEAASFTDAVASNYAHFITEVLPRLHMFVRYAPAHIPLIIDAALHANFLTAIRIVAGPDRPLMPVVIGQAIRVRKLWVMSVCGYIPFERRPGTTRWQGHSQGVFSPMALQSMRDAVKSLLLISSAQTVERKIFIRRNSGYRNISNSLEIENSLVACGFEVVEPEKLSFEQQVSLFSSASVVVGATGAALANIVFCQPECRLVILHGEHKCMTYYYWQNIARACGGEIICVLGKIAGMYGRSIHGDFYVAPKDVLAALQSPVVVERTLVNAQ